MHRFNLSKTHLKSYFEDGKSELPSEKTLTFRPIILVRTNLDEDILSPNMSLTDFVLYLCFVFESTMIN